MNVPKITVGNGDLMVQQAFDRLRTAINHAIIFVAQFHNGLLGRSDPSCHPASAVDVDTSSFSRLTPADNTVQKALQSLDSIALASMLEFGPTSPPGAYREVVGTVFPTLITWYDVPGPGRKKIMEKTITWTGTNATTIVWRLYDSAETLITTVTDVISYTDVFETSRTRTVS